MTKVSGVTDSRISTANLTRHLQQAAIELPLSLAVAVQKSRRQAFSLSKTLSYHEINFFDLNRQSDEIAFALNQYGIKRGMKTVLMVTPSIEFFALTFALFKAGIVPILVDPGMGVKNLKQCFAESSPDAFIGIPKAHIARKLFGWGKSSIKFLLTVGGSSLFGGISLDKLLKTTKITDQPYPMVKLAENEMAAILFTSGSTGVPKGVVYSHKMFEAQINALKNDYGIVAGERDLATFPLFSLFGPALGMASIIPDMDASKPITANPDYIFAAIEKYQCSNLFANPALIEVLGQAALKTDKCRQYKLPSLKRVISAGAPATLPSIECFSKMLIDDVEVLNSYGATESLPLTKIGSKALLTTTRVTDNGGGICVGLAIKGVEIKIIAITEEDIVSWCDDLALPVNTIGEIVVKGDMVSQSYYQRPSATAQAKIVDTDDDAQSVYRHRMGDLGYLDDNGQLWMCGRKAHRVEASGTIFFSIPCERIFNTHKLVKRSALVGVDVGGIIKPLLCIELNKNAGVNSNKAQRKLFNELKDIGSMNQQSKPIVDFLIHPDFPVDIRHNAKIYREKLAVWAQKKIMAETR
ncbi:MAG: fatty acid CoA ligase family protein [Colwellia sp.]|nr:fatty acid CoA ligase family protein [Colwellia sp.]